MVNPVLVEYVKSQFALGISEVDIAKAATAAGWTIQDIADSVRAAHTPSPAPLAPTSASFGLQVQPALSEPTHLAGPSVRSRRIQWYLSASVVIIFVGVGGYLLADSRTRPIVISGTRSLLSTVIILITPAWEWVFTLITSTRASSGL